MFEKLLQKTEKHYKKSLPFVIYSKPGNSKVIGIFQQNSQLYSSEDYLETGFVFAPFNSDRTPVLLRPDKVLSCIFEASATEVSEPIAMEPEPEAKSEHLKLVQTGLHAIKTGPIRKVVLSRKLQEELNKDPFKIFSSLLFLYPKAFCYLWYHPKIGMWLGATPETLIFTKNNTFKTVALAATQKVQKAVLPNWGSKEITEQALVTEYISNTLKGIVDHIEVSEVGQIKAGSLWHLRSTITGTFKDGSLGAIINGLHPTPAVCGQPLKDALRFIAEQEHYDREYYTGFLGELHLEQQGETHLFVNLRCMQIKNNEAIIYVGGGITADSVPELEWQETIDKTDTIRRALTISI